MDQKSVIFAGVSLLFLALLSCGQEPKKMEATLKDPELARRLAAVYAGEVPCADCEGIDYRLDLRPDFSYEARMIYKGKSEEPFEFSGAYAFTQDSIVVLEKETPGMNYFRIVPAGLIMLDLEGREVTGALADRYKLTQLSRGGRMADAPQEQEGAPNTAFIKKLYDQGIDFYARGNEPGWMLDMDFDNMFRFSTMGGDKIETPPTEPAMAQDAPVTRYAAETEAGSIIISIAAEDCVDNMSGEKFTHKVRVEFKKGTDADYTTYESCGRYVTDYRLAGLWTLTEMGGEAINAEGLAKGAPQLNFDPDALRISGHSSCNNLMGGFHMEKDAVVFGQLASTMMACPDMAVGTAFNRMITGRQLRYAIDGDKLTFTHPGGETLVFQKAE